MRRIAEVAKLFADSETITIAAVISPFKQERAEAKEIIGSENFIEAYVDASLEVCEQRDVKGLYKKARAGEIPKFTGIDSPYEAPNSPDILLESGSLSIKDCVSRILFELEKRNYIK
jgi:adenylylsulfate kinase